MTDSVKATRATIAIGSTLVDAFMLPDGSYRMSLSQTAECVGKPARSTFDFLKSKALKRLLEEAGSTFDFLPETTAESLSTDGYSPDVFVVDQEEGNQGQTRIRGLTLELVTLYWAWESFRSNKTALFLIVALATESLERRFDHAFGVVKALEEYNDRLAERLTIMERDLRDAIDFEAITSYEKDYLEQVLKQHGIDPWALPSQDADS